VFGPGQSQVKVRSKSGQVRGRDGHDRQTDRQTNRQKDKQGRVGPIKEGTKAR